MKYHRQVYVDCGFAATRCPGMRQAWIFPSHHAPICLLQSGPLDKHGPDIIYLREGWPRRHQIAEFLKEFGRIVVSQNGRRIEPQSSGARAEIDEDARRIVRRPPPVGPSVSPANAATEGPPRPLPRTPMVAPQARSARVGRMRSRNASTTERFTESQCRRAHA
jgi:hypothetical protein